MLSFIIDYIIPPSSVHDTDDDIFPDEYPPLPNDPALASREFLRRFVCEYFTHVYYRTYYTNFIVEMSDERAIQMGKLLIELIENRAPIEEFHSRFFKELKIVS